MTNETVHDRRPIEQAWPHLGASLEAFRAGLDASMDEVAALREPDVMVVGIRCAECGKAADSWRFTADPFREFSFPARVTAAEARIWSQPHPAASHCPGAVSLLALEPVPDGAA